MSRKHQLAFEAEHIERDGALGTVEGAQRLNLFRSFNQVIAHRKIIRDMLLAVTPAARHDLRHFLVRDQRGAVADRGNLRAQFRIGIGLQEIRQLHDMAIGVVKCAIVGCVSHDDTSWRVGFGGSIEARNGRSNPTAKDNPGKHRDAAGDHAAD